MFRIRNLRIKRLNGWGYEFIRTKMWDFDFVMMIVNRLWECFDFIDLWEWNNLLSNMNMIHTKSSISLIIREEFFIHNRSWWNIKIFTIGKLRVIELRVEEIIFNDFKNRLLLINYNNFLIVIVSVDSFSHRYLYNNLLLWIVCLLLWVIRLLIDDLLLIINWLLINHLLLIDRLLINNLLLISRLLVNNLLLINWSIVINYLLLVDWSVLVNYLLLVDWLIINYLLLIVWLVNYYLLWVYRLLIVYLLLIYWLLNYHLLLI